MNFNYYLGNIKTETLIRVELIKKWVWIKKINVKSWFCISVIKVRVKNVNVKSWVGKNWNGNEIWTLIKRSTNISFD